jgi:hypothetical protein
MLPFELQILRLTAALRTQLLDAITDDDLAFALPGNRPLGDLCLDNGDTQRSYIDSFRTGLQAWDVKNEEPGLSRSVERLRAWYAAMDAEFEAVVGAIPEETFRSGTIDRGDGFQMPMGAQFHTWREAILIFCAKADVYLRALGRDRPEHWQHWIG